MLKLSLARIAALTAALLAPALSVSALRADDMPTGQKGDMMMWIKDAETKLEQLADAMPEKSYSWRPGKGVRSVGEVYMHVAGANLALPAMAGGPAPPAGFNNDTYDKSQTKKAEITKALKESFASMEQALMNTSDADMDKPTDLMGMKTTYRGVYLLCLAHCHEHLGQSIAYARMNNVVPPWTAKQNAMMKDQKEKAASK